MKSAPPIRRARRRGKAKREQSRAMPRRPSPSLRGSTIFPAFSTAPPRRRCATRCSRSSPRRRCFARACRGPASRFRFEMSNCGPLGWVSDEARLSLPADPSGDRPRPGRRCRRGSSRPSATLAPGAPPPEACLINLYDASARMGLHQDRDEEDFSAPVVSLSLGDTALFRVGGLERNAPTRSFRLASGDAMTLRRRGPPRLPRRRPHLRRLLDPACRRAAGST